MAQANPHKERSVCMVNDYERSDNSSCNTLEASAATPGVRHHPQTLTEMAADLVRAQILAGNLGREGVTPCLQATFATLKKLANPPELLKPESWQTSIRQSHILCLVCGIRV